MKKIGFVFAVSILFTGILLIGFCCKQMIKNKKKPKIETPAVDFPVVECQEGCIELENVSPTKRNEKKNKPVRQINAGFIGNNTPSSTSTKNRRNNPINVQTKSKKLITDFDSKKQYINRYAELAIEEQKLFGVPADFALAQAILHNSISDAGYKLNNHFALKCKKENYGETGCVEINGSKFAKYNSVWSAWRAHSKFLTQRKYYSHIKGICGDNSNCWANEAQKAKYSLDKNYAKKLIQIIDDNDLRKYNTSSKKTAKKPVKKWKPKKQPKPKGKLNVSPVASNKLPINRNYTWLFSPSHTSLTPGKRFKFKKKLPNGEYTIYEYKLNRRIVNAVASRCNELGLNYRFILPKDTDKPNSELKERVSIANNIEKQKGNTILLTFDHNAAGFNNENFASISDGYEGNGKKTATGMEAFHHKNNLKMKHFLDVLGKNVEKRLPDFYNTRGTKAKNFYTIRKTNMPSCIMELAFFDNYKEACFILSDKFLNAMTEAIVETLCHFSGKRYVSNGVNN